MSFMSIKPPVTNLASSGGSRNPTYSLESLLCSDVDFDSLGDISSWDSFLIPQTTKKNLKIHYQ